MRLTPNDLEVLLHCYYSPERHPRHHATAVLGAIEMWIHHGCIEVDGKRTQCYNVTSRGTKFIEMLLETPLPVRVEQWFDPRELS